MPTVAGTERERPEVDATLTSVDPRSENFRRNQEAMLTLLEELDEQLAESRAGGGEKYVERHRGRGKLLPRERIELMLDRDSPFLELMPFVGWGSNYKVGGSVAAGIGVVEGILCMLIANDPTVRGGALNPFAWRKISRMLEIAGENRLPVINFVESGGADLPSQAELFVPGGQLFRELTRLSAAAIPTVALVFGNSTAGGAYIPGMSDYTIFVKEGAKVFLGGPPLVEMATGEISGDEELGGAEMHARTSGLADYMARDELHAIALGREVIADLRTAWGGVERPASAATPLLPAEELHGIPSSDLKVPFDPREVIVRFADGSRFREFKPLYGSSLATGWIELDGMPLGVLANVRGVLFSEEAQKATQFIQLANQREVPLLFIHNTTGFMVGKEYEQGGIIKDGAKMINAVSNSRVPHIGLIIGASYGAANYAMSGRAYRPRFLFSWPNAKVAVMGPEQMAGVLSIVARGAAAAAGRELDEEADASNRAAVQEQIETEQVALANSSRGYDDAIIDPADTRAVLSLALSACAAKTGRAGGESGGFGVFRM